MSLTAFQQVTLSITDRYVKKFCWETIRHQRRGFVDSYYVLIDLLLRNYLPASIHHWKPEHVMSYAVTQLPVADQDYVKRNSQVKKY